MHIRMAVIERYRSLSFFRGFIMQLPLIQRSCNKAEIFMRIAQFISDTFSRRNAAPFLHEAGLWRSLQSSRITSRSTERQRIWITEYLVHLKSPACIVRSAVITFRRKRDGHVEWRRKRWKERAYLWVSFQRASSNVILGHFGIINGPLISGKGQNIHI